MSQCPVCLQTVNTDGVLAAIFEHHLQDYLDRSCWAYASSADRVLALQQYLICSDTFVTLANTICQHKPDISRRDSELLVKQWKNEADLYMTPYRLACGHHLHTRCVSQLIAGHYDVEQSTTLRPRHPFVSLPKLPRLTFNTDSIQCPICKQVDTNVRDSLCHFYDEQCEASDTWGPYRLHPQSLVWMYDECHQPGHPEAGSLGRLTAFDATRGVCSVTRLPDNRPCTVPVRAVFDLASLGSTGIPARDEVARCASNGAPYALCTELVSVPDALMAAESVFDRLWVAQLKRRLEYCHRVMRDQSLLLTCITEYLQSSLVSRLVRRVSADIAVLWRSKILPRVGFAGMALHPLLIRLVDRPIPYPVLDKVAQLTRLHHEVCATILRYGQTGYICNTSTAPEVIGIVQKLQRRPENAEWFVEFRLSPQLLDVASFTLSEVDRQMYFTSEIEAERVRRWYTSNFFVVRDRVAYLLPRTAQLAECLSSETGYTLLPPAVTLALADSQENVPLPLPYSTLPAVYRWLPTVRERVDALRDNPALRAPTATNNAAADAVDATTARTKLAVLRARVWEQLHIDLNRVSYFDMDDLTRQRINRVLREI